MKIIKPIPTALLAAFIATAGSSSAAFAASRPT